MNYSRIDHELIFWTRIVHELNRLMGQLMRLFMGINGEIEKPFPLGRGWGRLLKSPSLQGGVGVGFQKSNNFERFFSDSTLTFLTSRNTFRLPILPIRRIVFLSLPQIFLCLPLIFLCLPLIFPGCASKSPILKGKWRKKGGASAPPISLYKYNTFRRQKQEVLKPKKGVGCGKCFEGGVS